jgi:hypothetical protein
MKRLPHRLLCLLLAGGGILLLITAKPPRPLPGWFANAHQVQALGLLLGILGLLLLRLTREK